MLDLVVLLIRTRVIVLRLENFCFCYSSMFLSVAGIFESLFVILVCDDFCVLCGGLSFIFVLTTFSSCWDASVVHATGPEGLFIH